MGQGQRGIATVKIIQTLKNPPPNASFVCCPCAPCKTPAPFAIQPFFFHKLFKPNICYITQVLVDFFNVFTSNDASIRLLEHKWTGEMSVVVGIALVAAIRGVSYS